METIRKKQLSKGSTWRPILKVLGANENQSQGTGVRSPMRSRKAFETIYTCLTKEDSPVGKLD